MPKIGKLILTLVLLAMFVMALLYALRGQQAAVELQQEQAAPELNGLIALDVEPYFKDERVRRILAQHRLPVKATRIGSREMASKVVAGSMPDFFFTTGVVSANQIGDAARKQSLPLVQSAPFHSPLVIASWLPIAKILEANGMARPLGERTYGVDMAKLTAAMLAKTRWKELKDSGGYDVSRRMLVSTTDVRRSNSAAMYLALTAYAANGDMVTDRATAAKSAARLADLFKSQGYQENYVNGNFDDYVNIGIGKTPLAFIYEFQMVKYALDKQGVTADQVLLYPQPTIVNKETFLAASERARALGELLSSDKELQRIAVEYGFRIADSGVFMQTVKPTGLAVAERVAQVIDPPSFELLADMIDVVTQEMTK